MLNTTLSQLRCPKKKPAKSRCDGRLRLGSDARKISPPNPDHPEIFEVPAGSVECESCQSRYPILAGVLILVPDVREYLLAHVKGISALVKDAEIPKVYLKEYLAEKAELAPEHIEEDLESKRVVALYLMNHYLRVGMPEPSGWWRALRGETSPLIDRLIRENWDSGPFQAIAAWFEKLPRDSRPSVVEFGCGVGGLGQVLAAQTQRYLGLDSSFASIALGRHLLLGASYAGTLAIPEDLLAGPTARPISLPIPAGFDGSRDLIVADFEHPPIADGSFDLSIALNTIDMLERPERLPEMQARAVMSGGRAIQSCPYIWHESVARRLRAQLPKTVQTSSSRAVEHLYEKAGFRIDERIEHHPWLFFKHVRQLEIYSVHLFFATRA